MRNGQNNKRMRNRNNNNNNRNDGGRRGQNPMTRVFESNGPDIKIRGTASHVAEKYVQLARDARSSGDPVAAENYYQHAEHYFRLIAAAQEQFRQNQPQPRTDNEMASEDGDDEGESFSHFGQEPGFVPVQPQPFVPRDNNPRDQRDGQPYQPREQHQPREHRPQPQFQPAAATGDSGYRQRRPAAIVHHRTAAADQRRPGRLRGRRTRSFSTPPPPAAWPASRRHGRARGSTERRFQSGERVRRRNVAG